MQKEEVILNLVDSLVALFSLDSSERLSVRIDYRTYH